MERAEAEDAKHKMRKKGVLTYKQSLLFAH